MRTVRFFPLYLVLAAALLVTLPCRSLALDESAAVESIKGSMERHFSDGYRALDGEKIIALYTADAQITTFLQGTIGIEDFRAFIDWDLDRHKSMECAVEISQIAFFGDEALVTAKLSITGARKDGAGKVRKDLLYFKMREAGAEWKAFLQSYRSDFVPQATPKSH